MYTCNACLVQEQKLRRTYRNRDHHVKYFVARSNILRVQCMLSHLKLPNCDRHRLRVLPKLQRPSPYVLTNGHVLGMTIMHIARGTDNTGREKTPSTSVSERQQPRRREQEKILELLKRNPRDRCSWSIIATRAKQPMRHMTSVARSPFDPWLPGTGQQAFHGEPDC